MLEAFENIPVIDTTTGETVSTNAAEYMQKDFYNRIRDAVTAAGAEARETATGAGLYYDGTQHGEIIDCIFVSVDKYPGGHYDSNAAKIAAAARKAAGRIKNASIKEVSHPHFYIYIIMTAEDRERADALQQEADTFLNAFHQERHRQNVNGEPDDANKAIKAGHAALKAAGYMAA